MGQPGRGECAFCGGPLGTSVPAGRGVVMPDYCRGCGQKYSKELGPGWDRQPWAVEYFQAHRRLLYVENKEATWARLDQGAAQEDQATLGDLVDSSSADTAPGRPGAAQDPVLDSIIQDMAQEGKGGNRIHRELKSMGWDLSQRTVYYRLAQAKKATHKTLDGQVAGVDLLAPDGDPVPLGPAVQETVQKVC
jgi:hypothetical protein